MGSQRWLGTDRLVASLECCATVSPPRGWCLMSPYRWRREGFAFERIDCLSVCSCVSICHEELSQRYRFRQVFASKIEDLDLASKAS
eukprot:566934-Amphidinium_carterae.1